MSEITIIKCDRCGKEIEDKTNIFSDEFDITLSDIDLCSDCRLGLKHVICDYVNMKDSDALELYHEGYKEGFRDGGYYEKYMNVVKGDK